MNIALFLIAAAGPDFSAEIAREIARQSCGGNDSNGEIVVCGNRDQDRYRITDPNAPFDPEGEVASVARERSRWIEQGDTGIHSCSAVGPGGYTGCRFKEWKQQRQQKGWYM